MSINMTPEAHAGGAHSQVFVRNGVSQQVDGHMRLSTRTIRWIRPFETYTISTRLDHILNTISLMSNADVSKEIGLKYGIQMMPHTLLILI
jgi:hypothetical protein